MLHINILILTLTLTHGVGIITYLFMQYKKYRLNYIKSFAFMTIALNISCLFYMVLLYFSLNLWNSRTNARFSILISVFFILFLSYLLFYIGIYYLTAIVKQINRQNLTVTLRKYYYWGGYTATAAAAIGIAILFLKKDSVPLRIILSILYILTFGLLLLINHRTITGRGHEKGQNSKIARALIVTYSALFAVEVILRLLSNYGGMRFPIYLTSVYFLSTNTAASLILYFLLADYAKISATFTPDKTKFDILFSKYGLTRREQEIATLLIGGKTNQEIEDTLFISRRTIKFHTYNIYRKTGVHSRIQLSNLFRNDSD